MSNKPKKFYRSYLLHVGLEPSPLPDQSPTRSFIVEEVSEWAQRQEFYTLEQVMNFLLDELLGHPKEVQELEDD